MIVRIHKTGTSFKGCAAYLLHDKDASTSERVGWVATHNLGTDNPHTAWRVMAATAMKQGELKRAAGISGTGRKTKGTVLHYSLSWKGVENPEELTKEAMLRAAKSSLGAYGVDPALFKPGAKNIPKRKQYADEHQAVIICHTDEKHPHVHIMVNRVHPEHGCILPNGKDQDKLSAWANEYEHSTGMVLCKNRADNWDSRKRGIWVKGDKNMPRHTFEMIRKTLPTAANENRSPALQRLMDDQQAKNVALGREGGLQAKKHKQAWRDLAQKYQAQQKAIRERSAEKVAALKKQSAAEYKPLFSKLRSDHTKQLEAFQEDEAGKRSMAGNVWESMKLLPKIRVEDPHDLKIKDVFAPFAGAGARLELLQKSQAQEKRGLERRQEAALKVSVAEVKTKEKAAHSENTELYIKEKSSLELTQNMEVAALRAKWKKRNDDQAGAYTRYANNLERSQAFKDEYAAAALNNYGDERSQPSHSNDNAHDRDDGRER